MKLKSTLSKPVFNMFLTCFILFFFFLTVQVIPTIAEADPLPADDFNDNTLGDMWYLDGDELTKLWLEETNQRLEGRLTGNVSDHTAICASNQWQLSTDHDFSMQVDWHFSKLLPSHAYAGIGFGVIKIVNSELQASVNIEANTDEGEAKVDIDGYLNEIETVHVDDMTRLTNSGVFYVSYDSANDRLYLSINGYLQSNSPDNGDWVFEGMLKGSWNADAVSVMLNFFCENNNDIAFNSGDAYFDNFQINQGFIKGNCDDGDINCDGNIDLTDAILSLKITVGINPDQAISKSADVNADGRIGIAETIYILEVVAGILQQDTDTDGDGYTVLQGDCDDDDGAVHPGATEVCDGKDNDCDGDTDEGCGVLQYIGRYNGTYSYVGNEMGAWVVCIDVQGNVFGSGDHNFDDIRYPISGTVSPSGSLVFTSGESGAATFEGAIDQTGVVTGTWETSPGAGGTFSGQKNSGVCDCTDADSDHYFSENGCLGPVDCDDDNSGIHPGATEICDDGIDNDCDEQVDMDDTDCVSSEIVNFPDSNLESAVRDAINKPVGDILKSDLSGLGTAFYARDLEIQNLEGLQYCTGLWMLNLERNHISDISSLANLTNLRGLTLSSNQISDISALANLTNLRDLTFENNQVSNISALANLTDLNHLYLSSNQVSDINALENLTNLTGLSLDSNQVSDINALENLTNLEYLRLGDNQISNINALENLTNLIDLVLYQNYISEISALVSNNGIGNGDSVAIQYNPLNTASCTLNIPTLVNRGVNVAHTCP